MSIFDPNLPFDENKPFYSIVVGYLVQLHGCIELSSRGLFQYLEGLDSESMAKLKSGQDERFQKAVDAVHGGGITGLLGQQQLESKVMSKSIRVDIELLARKAFWNHESYLDDFMRMSSASLVVLAHEVTSNYHTHDPL